MYLDLYLVLTVAVHARAGKFRPPSPRRKGGEQTWDTLRGLSVNGEEITGAFASILGAKALKPWKLKRSKDGGTLPVVVRLKYTLE